MQPVYPFPCLTSPPRDSTHTIVATLSNNPPRRDRSGETARKRFHLKQRLGSGTYGDAYLAWDSQLERFCVLKFCANDEMLKSEARALAGVSHPNIVTLFDHGTLREAGVTTSYLVLEYVNGGELLRYAGRLNLNPRQRVKLFLSACRGVLALHDRGLIHCDLKPANLVVDAGTGQAKVIDLGLARAVSGLRDGRPSFLGTPGYAALEQYDPHLCLGSSADVHALGVILFELLTGTPPYPRPGAGVLHSREAIEQTATSEVDVGVEDPSLNAALNRVVRPALAKVPQDRPSVHQIIADLHSLVPQ